MPQLGVVCKENMPKKVPLGLLEIEKRGGTFGVKTGYITTNYRFEVSKA